MSPLEKTREIVAQVLGISPERIAPDAPLAEVATLDSLSLAEIAAALDDAFAVRLPSDDLAEARTARELAELVERAPRR